MIVPLAVQVERVHVDRHDLVYPPLDGVAREEPVYRVAVASLDTETGECRAYDFYTCIDKNRDEREGIGRVVISDLEENREYLTKLRDELNGVLGDA